MKRVEGLNRRYAAGLVYLVFLFGLAEITCCIAHSVVAPMPDRVFLTPSEYEVRQYFDPELGWTLRGTYSSTGSDCLGEPVLESIRDGFRVSSKSSRALPRIAIFGDSYAFGDEVNDHQTIASVLTTEHSLPALNFGVKGYGPAQMLLRYERRAKGLPESVHEVVFLLFSDNIYRLSNRYRPVFMRGTGFRVWKPYYRKGHLIVPGIEDYDQYVAFAEQSFVEGFWATPRARFPYTWSFWKLSETAFFRHNVQRGVNVASHRAHAAAYADPELMENFEAVLRDIFRATEENGHRGIVFFVLHSRYDAHSLDGVIPALRRRVGHEAIYGFRSNPDWDRYQRVSGFSGINCHPSPYGYAFIAAELAAVVGKLPGEE